MTEYAALFPGQGAQYVGMGKDLYESFQSAKRIFDTADRILGFSLSELCFNGPESELTLTYNSQPAIYTMSIAAYFALKELYPEFSPAAAAGLSLGEFSALTAAGALSFEEGVLLVRNRGRFMQEAAQANPGKMASILGLDRESVETICRELCAKYKIGVANINSPTQIVISGQAQAVEEGMAMAKAKGARKCIELKVSGAFHSPLMALAQAKLEEKIKTLDLKPCDIPVVFNATGTVVSDITEIKRSMIRQVTSPVLWTDTMAVLRNTHQIKKYVEIGCGTVLKGLVRGIDPEAVTYSAGKKEEIIKTIEEIKRI